jgi:hypothetical protein
MTSQNALANAKLLFKALAAREANLDEPIPNIQITDVEVAMPILWGVFPYSNQNPN